ncbi:unnamed protein product [Schistocephalus solidus]|uniref:Dynactin domain-containing protein n=1 Tax=Schistocephalus solidus TaxID=70667 RepID=A0A183SJ51_SCHSO|nr:unnamed protein product [Schistocephalus solidus]
MAPGWGLVAQALQQEVFSLKARLEAKTKMEADYLEEIEQLKRELSELQNELKATQHAQPVSRDQESINLVEPDTELHDVLTSEIEDLRNKLKAVELENRGLRERLDILELTKDATSLNLSCDPVLAETNLELEHLREQLQVCQSEKTRMERLLAEKDADIESAHCHASELQMALNMTSFFALEPLSLKAFLPYSPTFQQATREELADAVTELEYLKIQSNPSSNSRGNSIFSELEDRRVRAEKLVAKQKAKIDQLRQDLALVRSESRQRMLQFIQETEDKFNKRDTQIIEDLKAERDRLVLEVDRLEATLRVFKDEKYVYGIVNSEPPLERVKTANRARQYQTDVVEEDSKVGVLDTYCLGDIALVSSIVVISRALVHRNAAAAVLVYYLLQAYVTAMWRDARSMATVEMLHSKRVIPSTYLLHALREADKFAEAFRPGKNNGKRLIAALESRLMDASQRVSEAEEKVEALRRRLLVSSHARYELSRELLQQMALLKRLTTEMQAMKESPSDAGAKENIAPLSNSVEADNPSKVPSPLPTAAVRDAQNSGPVFLWEVDSAKHTGAQEPDDGRRRQQREKMAEELGCKPS